METNLELEKTYKLNITFTNEDNLLQFIKQLGVGLRDDFKQDDSHKIFESLYEEVMANDDAFEKYEKLLKLPPQ